MNLDTVNDKHTKKRKLPSPPPPPEVLAMHDEKLYESGIERTRVIYTTTQELEM